MPALGPHPLSDADTPVVRGTRLQTRDGHELLLQGVNIPSLCWLVDGEHVKRSFHTAIHTWKANLIRLPVNDAFWFGRGIEEWNRRGDGGASYRARIDALADYAASNGCYLILDLHAFKAPTEAHARFWADAARRYANRPGILFGLINEPHSISWELWRDGGEIPPDAGSKTAVAENNEAAGVESTIGMQALVRAVRDAGASNVVVCAGLDWGYDLSGIPDGFALDDLGGNGILYDTHIYPWKRDWENRVLPCVRSYAVIVGEVGCQTKPMPFETVAENPYAWVSDVFSFLQENRLHWAAWSFHPAASPCVVSDWNFTPTPYWGAFVRAVLEGAQFRGGRLR